MCAQNEAGNRRGNANQRRRPARHGTGIAVRAFGTRPEDESHIATRSTPSKASTIAARISRTSIAYNLELSWLEPVVANAGPPRRNFAVGIGVGKGTAAAPIGVRSQHRGAWGRRGWRGHCRPQDRAQAHHGLVGGFDAHISGSRLRQTISVFCSPGDRTRPAMQFFGPQNCGAVPGGLPTSRRSEDCYGFPKRSN